MFSKSYSHDARSRIRNTKVDSIFDWTSGSRSLELESLEKPLRNNRECIHASRMQTPYSIYLNGKWTGRRRWSCETFVESSSGRTFSLLTRAPLVIVKSRPHAHVPTRIFTRNCNSIEDLENLSLRTSRYTRGIFPRHVLHARYMYSNAIKF